MKKIKSSIFLLTTFFIGFSQMASAETAFDFEFKSIDGKPMPLSAYKGKELMIVNTASMCGFTKQYATLQNVWKKFKDKGFVLIGVPSNDFGGQEPGDEKEIKKFCEVNFNISFPMTEKVDVVRDNAHPFYKWAKKQAGMLSAPKWNFHKYLISPDGKIADWFISTTSPESEKVVKEIEKNLPENFQKK